MGKPAVAIDLTEEQRAELEGLGRRQTAQGLARRAEIVLLAAEGLQSKVIGPWVKRRPAKECLTVLREIDAKLSEDLEVHLIMDDDATHKTLSLRTSLAKRPHGHVHFTPTGASWLNQVERLVALLREKQRRRDVHRSTQELERAIQHDIDTVNDDPKPFRWTKSADDILTSIKRFCTRTFQIAERQNEIERTLESGR